MSRLIMFTVLCTVLVSCLWAYDYNISSNISVNTTWTTGNNYNIQGQITVLNGAALTIEQGVQVRFDYGSQLTIEGSIAANGSSAFPVQFKPHYYAANPLDRYTNIELLNAENSSFTYSIFAGSDISSGMVRVNGYCGTINFENCSLYDCENNSALSLNQSAGAVNLNNCVIYNVDHYGVRIQSHNGTLSLTDVEIINCISGIYSVEGYGAAIGASNLSIQNTSSYPIVTNIYNYATMDEISAINPGIACYGITDSNLYQSVTLPDHNLPYRMNNPLYVQQYQSLNLEAGVDIKFAQHGRISLNPYASLIALGTASHPITFSAFSDDIHWSNINLDTSSNLQMSYCTLTNGGYPDYYGYQMPTISANNPSSVSISNCTIAGGTSHAMQLQGTTEYPVTLNNVNLAGAADTGLYITNRYIDLDINGISISSCGTGIKLPANLVEDLNSSLLMSNNSDNSIFIHSEGQLYRNTTFRSLGYDYKIPALSISTNYTATIIEPGCDFYFGFDQGLFVTGTIHINGTESMPVTFNKLPGSSQNMRGIFFDAGCTEAVLSYCQFNDCGTYSQYGYLQAAVHVYRADNVILNHCSIYNATGRGLWIDSANSSTDAVTVTDLTIDGCGAEAFYVWAQDYVLNIDGLSVSNCSSYPLTLNARWLHQVQGLDFVNNSYNMINLLYGGYLVSQQLGVHGYPYLVTGSNLVVDYGQTVEMIAGTTMYFDATLGMTVNGTLLANGTSTNPITFTRKPGMSDYWGTITINNDKVARLKHCNFSYGGRISPYGYDTCMIEDNGSMMLNLQDCLITNVQAQAIWVGYKAAADSFVVDNVIIDGCGTDGLYMPAYEHYVMINELSLNNCARNPISIPPVFCDRISGLSISNSPVQHIRLFSTGTIYRSITMPDHGYPYLLEVDLSVYQGCSLTVSPGVNMHFTDGRNVYIYGAIYAIGTQEQPINFIRKPGTTHYWQGFILGGSAWDAVFEHCIISHAGKVSPYGQPTALIMNDGVSRLSLKNCLLAQSQGHGIYYGASDPTDSLIIRNCQIQNVNGTGIHSLVDVFQVSVNGLNLEGGGGFPIYVRVNQINDFQNISQSGYTNPYFASTGTTLYENATWVDHGFAYKLFADLIVADGYTLNLGQGTTLIFEDYTYNSPSMQLLVLGAFNTLGTSTQPVSITGKTPGSQSTWLGIKFNNPDFPCSLTHTLISNAGIDQPYTTQDEMCSIWAYNANLSLDHCILRNSTHNLIKCDGASQLTITDCELYNADVNGILQTDGTINLLRNSITNCDFAGIYYAGGTINFGSSLAQWNDIYDNEINLYNATMAEIWASYVWWGDLSPMVFDPTIYDNEEGRGPVYHTPWTNSTHTQAYNSYFAPPQEPVLSRPNSSTLRLSWNFMGPDISYRVEASSDPYAESWDVLESGLTQTYLDLQVSSLPAYNFFRIIAVD